MASSLEVLRRIPADVPEAVAARAAAWRAGDPVATAVPAASVVLLRDTSAGLETYLLHRHARMAFAPSVAVFPGGRVEPIDVEPDPIRACAVREVAEETTVRLAPEALRPWAHWTTPEVEPRRYDTHFFLAALPTAQHAADVSGEADRADWTTPTAALRSAEDGRLALLPPTLSILVELADFAAVSQALQAAVGRVVEPVLPTLERAGGHWMFRYPRPRQ